MIDVTVDNYARMDTTDLRKKLDACLSTKRAIYAVVAITGSTEHGACDPLRDIIEMRKEVNDILSLKLMTDLMLYL